MAKPFAAVGGESGSCPNGNWITRPLVGLTNHVLSVTPMVGAVPNAPVATAGMYAVQREAGADGSMGVAACVIAGNVTGTVLTRTSRTITGTALELTPLKLTPISFSEIRRVDAVNSTTRGVRIVVAANTMDSDAATY